MKAREPGRLATDGPRAASAHDEVLVQGLKLLQELHRAPEADAAFAGRFDGIRNLFGLSRAELHGPPLSLDQINALQKLDLYVTLNGMRRAKGRSHHVLFDDQRAGNRRSSDLVALNAVWIDFDAYKLGLRPDDVYAAIVDQRDHRRIPPWSIRIYSGRGLWLVWRLRDDTDPDLPAKPTAENQDACSRINRALAARFEHMGADSNSTSLVRITRVPGSQNTKVPGPNGIVRWVSESPMPTYTVSELEAAFFGDLPHRPPAARPPRIQRAIPNSRRPAQVDRGTHRAKRAPRGRAFTSSKAVDFALRRWGLPLLDLFYLAFHRRDCTTGHRHHLIFWIAHLLNRVLPKEPGKRWEIRRICMDVNAEWTDQLLETEADRAIAKGIGWDPTAFIRHSRLTEIFKVTSAEAVLLRKLKTARVERKAARQEALKKVRDDWIEAKGSAPTVRELERELALAGHPTSRATVGRELVALGLRCPPSLSPGD